MKIMNIIIPTSTAIIIGIMLATIGGSIAQVDSYWIFYMLLPLALGLMTGWISYLHEIKQDAKRADNEVKGQ